MSVVVLPHVKFDKFYQDCRIELAKSAAVKLGYNRLAQAIAVPGALLFALRELEINPLSQTAVKDYKDSKRKHGMWSGTKAILRWIGVMIFGAMMATWGFAQNFTHVHCTMAVAGAILGLVGLFGASIYALDDDWEHGERWETDWRQVSLAGFSHPVPEHVLEKAVQIKDKCPEATFVVDQLVTTIGHREKPDRDPFLVVKMDSEMYYIDVWDEKEYEQKY